MDRLRLLPSQPQEEQRQLPLAIIQRQHDLSVQTDALDSLT